MRSPRHPRHPRQRRNLARRNAPFEKGEFSGLTGDNVALLPVNPKAVAWAAAAFQLEKDAKEYVDRASRYLEARGEDPAAFMRKPDWENVLFDYVQADKSEESYLLRPLVGLWAEWSAAAPLPSFGILQGEGLPAAFQPSGTGIKDSIIQFSQNISARKGVSSFDESAFFPIGFVGTTQVVLAASGSPDDPSGYALYPLHPDTNDPFWAALLLLILRKGIWDWKNERWAKNGVILWLGIPSGAASLATEFASSFCTPQYKFKAADGTILQGTAIKTITLNGIPLTEWAAKNDYSDVRVELNEMNTELTLFWRQFESEVAMLLRSREEHLEEELFQAMSAKNEEAAQSAQEQLTEIRKKIPKARIEEKKVFTLQPGIVWECPSKLLIEKLRDQIPGERRRASLGIRETTMYVENYYLSIELNELKIPQKSLDAMRQKMSPAGVTIGFLSYPGSQLEDDLPRLLSLESWYGSDPALRQIAANRLGARRALAERASWAGPTPTFLALQRHKVDGGVQAAAKHVNEFYDTSHVQKSPEQVFKALSTVAVAQRTLTPPREVLSVPLTGKSPVLAVAFSLYGWDEQTLEYGPIGPPLVMSKAELIREIRHLEEEAKEQLSSWKEEYEDVPVIRSILAKQEVKRSAEGRPFLLVRSQDRARDVGLLPGSIVSMQAGSSKVFVYTRGPRKFQQLVDEAESIESLANLLGIEVSEETALTDAVSLRQAILADEEVSNSLKQWALGTEYAPLWFYDVALSKESLPVPEAQRLRPNPMLALRRCLADKFGLFDLTRQWARSVELYKETKKKQGAPLPLPFTLVGAVLLDLSNPQAQVPQTKPWLSDRTGRHGVVLTEIPIPKQAGLTNVPSAYALAQILTPYDAVSGIPVVQSPKSAIRAILPPLIRAVPGGTERDPTLVAQSRQPNIFSQKNMEKAEWFQNSRAAMMKKIAAANEIDIEALDEAGLNKLKAEAGFRVRLKILERGLSSGGSAGSDPLVTGGREAFLTFGGIKGSLRRVGQFSSSPSASQRHWATRSVPTFGNFFSFARKLLAEEGLVIAKTAETGDTLSPEEMTQLFQENQVELPDFSDAKAVASALSLLKTRMVRSYRHKVAMGTIRSAGDSEEIDTFLSEMSRLNPSRKPRRSRKPRTARSNPLDAEGVSLVQRYLADPKKVDRAEVERAFRAGAEQADALNPELMKDLFPRKGKLKPDTWSPQDRLPQVLTARDPIRRLGDVPPEVVEEGRKYGQTPFSAPALAWSEEEGSLSLDRAAEILRRQSKSKQQAEAVPASAVLSRMFRKKRLKAYKAPPSLFSGGRDNDTILWMSPSEANEARVITYRRGDHIDSDVRSDNPADLPALLGQSIQTSMFWLVEKPTRIKRFRVWVGRIGDGRLCPVWVPGQPVSIESITAAIRRLMQTGEGCAQVYADEEGKNRDVMRYLEASGGLTGSRPAVAPPVSSTPFFVGSSEPITEESVESMAPSVPEGPPPGVTPAGGAGDDLEGIWVTVTKKS